MFISPRGTSAADVALCEVMAGAGDRTHATGVGSVPNRVLVGWYRLVGCCELAPGGLSSRFFPILKFLISFLALTTVSRLSPNSLKWHEVRNAVIKWDMLIQEISGPGLP